MLTFLCRRMHRRRISEVLSGGDRSEDEDSDDRAAALALRAGDPVETALRAALIGAIFVKHGREAPVRRRKLA